MDAEKLFNLVANDTLRNGVCRVCLQENEYLFNIFESSYDVYKPISMIFERFFSQEIAPGDGYPEVVCPGCLDRAVKALNFKDKFSKAISVEQKENITSEMGEPEEEGIILIVQTDDGECVQYVCKDMKKEESDEMTCPVESSNCVLNIADGQKLHCQNCTIPFFTVEALSAHMVTCFRCNICEFTHNNILDFKIHKNYHKNAHETRCPHCSGILKRGYHSLDNFKFPCTMCDFIFPCTIFLTRHLQTEHKNGLHLKNESGDYENHMIIKNDTILIDQTGYKCNLCGKSFSSLMRVNVHLAAMSCVYVCDMCDASYKLKSQLRLHMMDKHLGVKPHLCCVCGKRFVRRGMLKSHQRVHMQEKKFQCDICAKKFVSAWTLRYHLRLHTGERPFVCTICGDGFVKSSRLREHEQKWHIGKLQCPKCFTTFSQRCSLKTHMDRFHPNTYDRKQDYLVTTVLEQQDVIVQTNDILVSDLNTMYTIHVGDDKDV